MPPSESGQKQKRLKPKDIYEAVEQDDYKVVKEFVEKRGVLVASVNQRSQTPAHIAAIKGNLKIFRYLLEQDSTALKRKDLNGLYIPFLVIDFDHLDLLKYLVENHKISLYQQFDYTGSTLIHRAAECGHLHILKYLAEEKGANVDVTNKFKQPPVFLAAENKHLHVIRYLVEERNASLTMRDEHQHTILDIALNNDDLTLMKYVLDERRAKLDINMKNGIGITLVQRAVDLGRTEILVYLVGKKHADVNILSDWGESPLDSATRENHYEIHKYLVEHGAKTQVRNNRRKKPMQDTTAAGTRVHTAKLKRNRRDVIKLVTQTMPAFQQPPPLVHLKLDTLVYCNMFQTFVTLAGPIVAMVKRSFSPGSFLSPIEMLKDKMDSMAVDSINNLPQTV